MTGEKKIEKTRMNFLKKILWSKKEKKVIGDITKLS